MDPHTFKFIAFTLFSVACFVLGYAARRRRWLDERHSRTVHFHTVVWVWSAGALVAVWKLPIEWQSAWLAPMLLALIAAPMFAMAGVARWMKLPGKRAGVMVLAAGFSNLGFTLGAYVAYLMVDHERALGYAGSLMALFSVLMVLLGYPVARHYGSEAAGGQRLGTLMRQSLTSWTALPIYASAAGLTLSVLHVPFPEALQRYGVIDVLMFITAFGGYFGVGMRVRFSENIGLWREHLVLTIFKFALAPALALLMVWLAGATHWPLHSAAVQVFMIDAFMPAGLTIVILANVFHLDARYAGSLWVWNTLIFCAVVLPVIVLVMA